MRSIFLLLIISTTAYSQSDKRGVIKIKKAECNCVKENSKDLFYTEVDSMPSYPSGERAFIAYLNAAVVFPAYAFKPNWSSCQNISFVVLPDGTITEVTILFSDDKVVGEQMVKAYSVSKKWKPGKCKGKAVPVKMYKTWTSNT